MKIFVDSACIKEIQNVKAMGLLDGVTTNPSLIAREKLKAKRKFLEIINDICQECENLPVSVEVLSIEADKMITEGRILSQVASNVVVKLPCTEEGLVACHALSEEGIHTNMTLCFSPAQALLVAKAGATYVSPFVGRLDDLGEDGMALIANIRMIYNNYGLKTKILTASIRNKFHILNAARIGSDVVTVPYSVISGLMEHHLTDKGVEIFLEDAKRASRPDND